MENNMKKNLFMIAIAGLLMAALLSGCSKKEAKVADGRLKVAVTIGVEEGLVRAIAGDLVEVSVLVPKGGSPETFEASPVDIERFKDSDVYFSLDLPVENSKNLPSDGKFKTISLAEAAREEYMDLEFAPGERDHHNWLSPKRVKLMIEKIAETLIKEDPVNKETYLKNTEAYLLELDNLDLYIREKLGEAEGRTFIIFHPALGYFAEEYDLVMLALEEEGKEADPGRIAELVDLALKTDIKGVLTTEEISARQVEAFAEEIDGEVITVEVLSSDYIGMMKNLADDIGGILR